MTPRIGRVPKAITLVPLAALSAAWTVEAVNTPPSDVSAIVSRSSSQTPPAPAAEVPVLPETALVVPPGPGTPASVWGDTATAPGSAAPASPAMLSAPLIPPVALAAYQRAATVIDTADRACHLDWSLIAAIGRVESNHGSHGGGRLGEDGRVTPGIVGPALTGLAGTLLVTDTDGGRLDGDTRFDHAVGPMQFLPSTWSTVGVDADGDGQRDPQDIDDAALAAGVYLCSGAEDLSTDAGRRAALLRYNHSTSYVDTVLRLAGEYRSGAGLDLGLPAGLVAARAAGVTPVVDLAPEAEPAKTRKHKRHHASASFSAVGDTEPGSGDPAGGHQDVPGSPTDQPTPTPTDPPEETTDPTVVPATAEQLDDLCGDSVRETYPDATDDARAEAVEACAGELAGATLDDVTEQVDDVVATLLETIPGLEQAEPAPTGAPTSTAPTGDPTPADPTAPATTDPPEGEPTGTPAP